MYKKRIREKKEDVSWWEKYTNVFEIVFSFQMIYKLFLAAMSALGYFLHIYFFIFTLVTIIMEFAVMQVILKSVFIPLEKVIASLIVMVVFLY